VEKALKDDNKRQAQLLVQTESKKKKSEDAAKKALEEAKYQIEEAEKRAAAAAAASAGIEERLTWPSHWTKATDGDEDERHLVPVQVSERFHVNVQYLHVTTRYQQEKSPDWTKIEALLKSGIGCAVLTSLFRVESRMLYSEFDHRGKFILEKWQRLHQNGKSQKEPTNSEDLLNTKLLWHGTGSTDPLTVIQHQQGLDPRFGKGSCTRTLDFPL
jgi:hypothetical protein